MTGDDHFIRPDNDQRRINRTDTQVEADRMDLEIFRLIGSAERMQEKTHDMKWYGVKSRLIQARLLVRDFMHKDDAERTQP